MSKFKDGDTSFNFRPDSGKSSDSAGTARQDRYDNYSGSKHDHTWSATPRSGDGNHREGWVGRGDSSSKDSGSGK